MSAYFKNLQTKLHEIRKFGNDGVHDNFLTQEIEDKKAKLKEKAYSARLTIVAVLEDVHLICFDKKIVANTTKLTDITHLEIKETIFKSTVAIDYQMKLKAGMIHETLAKEYFWNQSSYLRKKGYLMWQSKNLCQLALTFYESACEI